MSVVVVENIIHLQVDGGPWRSAQRRNIQVDG